MAEHWLFFLDADGWLVGPESAPCRDEARTRDAALIALRNAAARSDLAALRFADREHDNPHPKTAQSGAA
jgi:hypothetical protein